MSIFKLPDLGEGLPDAEIVKWHVAEGDQVKVDDPLVSMETAKAIVDVPSPQTGKIKKLHGAAGDIIATGKPLVEFEGAKASEDTDKGTVVGTIKTSNQTLEESFTIGASKQTVAETKVKVLPAMRALAKQLNVDLANVQPAKAGIITAEDVQAAAHQTDNGDFETLHGVRRTMAIAMAKSHAEVAPVTIIDDADIHAWDETTDITVRIIQAVCAACGKEPALNAWFDGKRNARQVFDDVHLGIAMDTDEGLFVPVIKAANQKTADELRETVNAFKTGVRNRDLPPEALRGNTITLSNFGNFAGRYASPVVVPPTVSILGVGKIYEAVIPDNGKPAIHKLMPLSLSFDHRAVTGGESARFLAAVIEALQA